MTLPRRAAYGGSEGEGRALLARARSVHDVAVAPHLRGGQVGSALMRLLLDHPAVRGVRHVRLSTKDAMPFYRRLGFCNLDEAPRYPWTSTDMIKTRAPKASAEPDPRGSDSERADEAEPRVVASEQRNDERPRQAT